MAESCISTNQYYIKHINDPLSVNLAIVGYFYTLSYTVGISTEAEVINSGEGLISQQVLHIVNNKSWKTLKMMGALAPSLPLSTTSVFPSRIPT